MSDKELFPNFISQDVDEESEEETPEKSEEETPEKEEESEEEEW